MRDEPGAQAWAPGSSPTGRERPGGRRSGDVGGKLRTRLAAGPGRECRGHIRRCGHAEGVDAPVAESEVADSDVPAPEFRDWRIREFLDNTPVRPSDQTPEVRTAVEDGFVIEKLAEWEGG